jgi:phage terminase small subunit
MSKTPKKKNRPLDQWTEQELKDDCTDSQLAFLYEYLANGFNATQAYLDTNQTDKASTAQVEGHRTLRKPKIQQLLKRYLEEKAMTADEALARLAAIARGDIGDLLEFDDNGVIKVSLAKAKRLGLTHLIRKVKSKRIPEKDPDTGDILYTQEVQLELYSSHDALRDIARVHGLFTDNIHATIEGQVGVLRTGPDMDMDTWAEKVANYRAELQSKLNLNGKQ